MTIEQKEIIKKMRLEGSSYSQISTAVNLLEGTIKAFCSRNKIYSPKKDIQKQCSRGELCRCCGKPIVQNKNAKLKLFCNDKCRLSWWNNNQDKVNKKAIYKFKCQKCGIEFESYGNKSRKYCSHFCYIEFKKGGIADVKRAI